MKKQLLLLILLLSGILAQAQWSKSYLLDDFGDTTDTYRIEGRSFDGLTHYNDPNADPLEKFCVQITIDENNNVGLLLYENCTFSNNPFPGTGVFKGGTFRMRNSEGTTVKINIIGKLSKIGGLKLESDKFREFMAQSSGKVRCILKVGVAYYKFTLNATGYNKIVGE